MLPRAGDCRASPLAAWLRAGVARPAGARCPALGERGPPYPVRPVRGDLAVWHTARLCQVSSAQEGGESTSARFPASGPQPPGASMPGGREPVLGETEAWVDGH